ncbi:Scr1 family TA system antitoxin-like transcriptional regulator [Nocardia cerradoensis]|uniref:DUF5753 domain-containing protein n=1 Tax=Nocardia cerradoensis TaxID=85688 RepID=A0A231HD50_9NOCA|nr:Scr1 family TA system antitoxin-like transcriptional regulator [Nocardia cerradoensis]NKY47740.1 hypothetical protein [Nocardia cerradoensis]OXR46769.1 hypothetical protein B7C42_01747 [Nocardia cerradoensis]
MLDNNARSLGSLELHPGVVVQSFTLFEFPSLSPGRSPEPPVVFVEGFTGALFLEDDALFGRYGAAADDLQQVALSRDETRLLMRGIAEEYAGDE